MHVNEMTVDDFFDVPNREQPDIGEFDSLVIVPTEDMHESGYRCMAFVAVKRGEPVCRLGGGCDVLQIGGLGTHLLPKHTRRGDLVSWSVDCLSASGLVHLFALDCTLTCGPDISSFDIYAHRRITKVKD